MTDLRKMSNEAINERTQLADASQKELCAEISLAEDGEFGLGLFDVLQEMYNAGYARGAAPAEEMKPRCPKCGSDALELWVEEVGETVKVTCLKKPHGFLIQSVNDFAQFFALSPSRSGEPPLVDMPQLIAQEILDYAFRPTGGVWKLNFTTMKAIIQKYWLRPYFPPASQTPPICDGCGAGPMLDRGGFYDCFACGHNREKLATPASTARTDGPERNKMIVEIFQDDGGTWRGDIKPISATNRGGDTSDDTLDGLMAKLTRMTPRVFAAPGSVPPLCNDPDCGDCYDKREALEHAQKGVPQAEPPKEEKPWITGKL